MSIFSGALGAIKNRLFLLASFVSAGAAAAYLASPEPSGGLAVAVILQTLAGLSSNYLTSEAFDVVSKRINDKDILHNQHLTKAVRDTIGVILCREADEVDNDIDQEILRELAGVDAAIWEAVESDQRAALKAISDAHLVEMFSQTPEAFARFPALSVAAWSDLLRGLEEEVSAHGRRVELTEATRARVAEALHQDFPRVLYEVLKHDFANRGEAYGGLLIKLVGKLTATQVETLDEVMAIRGDTRTILAKLERIEPRIERIESNTDKTLFNTEEILRRLPDTDSAVAVKSPLYNLPQRNRLFTGRQSYLDRLKDEMRDHARAALSGMPGVGKTQTAIEYAYLQHQAQACDYVFYVRAATIGELLLDFAAIARYLNLPAKDNSDINLIAAAVVAWFEKTARWLLIFDNADDLQVLFDEAPESRHNYIPANRHGEVLLTRRPRDAGGFGATIEIKAMSDAEGARLLLRRAGIIQQSAEMDRGNPEIAAAYRIAREVGGLPLALDIAGAFIKETGILPTEYLKLYVEQGRLLRQERDAQDGYRRSVATVFSLAFNRIAMPDSDSEDDGVIARAAADLLRLCAFVAADAIPLEHFIAGASELGDDLKPAMGNKVWWAKAKGRALRFALLDHNSDGKTFDLHRLVQAVIRDEMDAATQCLWTERALRVLNEIFPAPDDFSNRHTCDLIVPHALDCLNHEGTCDFKTAETARLANDVAYRLDDLARYTEAEPLYQRALAIRQQVLGEQHSDTAEVLNNLAALYHAQGRYEEAAPLYQRALAIRQQVLGDRHPFTATSLNNLAELYNAQGRYEEAEPLHQRALAIRQQVLADQHPDTAQSLNNLAGLYRTQRRYEEAEPLFERALAIHEASLGDQHPFTATNLHNLAALYRAQGRYEEAAPLYQRALVIYEAKLGANHPHTIRCRKNLSELQELIAAQALRREEDDDGSEDDEIDAGG